MYLLFQIIDFLFFWCQSFAKGVNHLEDIDGNQILDVLDLIFGDLHLSLRDRPCKQRFIASASRCIKYPFIFILSCVNGASVRKIIVFSWSLFSISLLLLAPPEWHIVLVFFISTCNALVFTIFESQSQISLVTLWALHENFVTRVGKMFFNFHSEFYLLALWAWKALFWTVFIQMFLKHVNWKFLSFRTTVWAELKPCIATFLQMKIKLIIFENFWAALALIWTPKL